MASASSTSISTPPGRSPRRRTHHLGTYLIAHAGRTRTALRGWDVLGLEPLHRFYQGSDREWLFLGLAAGQLDELERCLRLKQVRELTDSQLAAAIEARLLTRPADAWVETLTAAGISAQRRIGLAELMSDPELRSRGLTVAVPVESETAIMPSVSPRLSLTPMRVGDAAARPGSAGAALIVELWLAAPASQLDGAWALQVRDLPPAW
jgi:hypothetical protein